MNQASAGLSPEMQLAFDAGVKFAKQEIIEKIRGMKIDENANEGGVDYNKALNDIEKEIQEL